MGSKNDNIDEFDQKCNAQISIICVIARGSLICSYLPKIPVKFTEYCNNHPKKIKLRIETPAVLPSLALEAPDVNATCVPKNPIFLSLIF
jgi:hypothetical protein|tara:strand:- start:1106 stop:1375 length:270 start_codon:yes stop_codon:yes gene_type:complete